MTVKAAQKAAQAAKAAAKAAVKFVKVAAKAIVAAVKATVAAVKGIVAAIAAGGWIAVVVILLICIIGLVVGSVFGIFAPNPDNENGITIIQTVREANAEYEARIAEIKSRYDYDMCFVTGEPCEWSLAIAVYAVKTNRTEDVVTFDGAKAEVLKEIYRRLNRMDVHTEQITVKETRLETQEDGSVVPVEQEVVKTYLYIDTVSLTAEEAANLYGFDTKAATATHNIAFLNLFRVKEIASNKIMAANSTYTAVPLGFPIPIVKSNLPYFPDGVYEIDGNANAYIPNTIESAMAE